MSASRRGIDGMTRYLRETDPDNGVTRPSGPVATTSGELVGCREGSDVSEVVVLEIRGVGGATAEEILDADVEQLTGDKKAGFFRRRGTQGQPHVEAYYWGGLTSGSGKTALWWVLFPFTLLNVAGWMFRPLDEETERLKEPAGSSLVFGRLLIVAGGLVLTALYLTWIVILTTDILAIDCGSDAECLQGWYMAPMRWFDGHLLWRLTVGLFLAGLVVFALFRLTLATQDKLEGFEPNPTYRAAGGASGGRLRRNTNLEHLRFWYRWEEHRRLTRWHIGVAVATLGGLAGYANARLSWPEASGLLHLSVVGVVLLAVAAIFLLTGPERHGTSAPGSYAGTLNGRRFLWTAFHSAVGLVAGILVWWLTNVFDVRTSSGALGLIRGVHWLAFGLYGFALVLLGVLWYRRRRSHRDSQFNHPGFRVLAPAIASGLAVYITAVGFGSLAHLVGRLTIGADAVDARGYNIGLVDLFAVGVVLVAAWLVIELVLARRNIADVKQDYTSDEEGFFPPDTELTSRQRAWAKQVAQARKLSDAGRNADRMLTALVAILIVGQVAQLIESGTLRSHGYTAPLFGWEPIAWLHAAAAGAFVLYLFPGLQLIRQAWRDKKARRQTAKVWDVLNFWPRRFHPLAAPCYGERAVPEFRYRVKQYLAEGKKVLVCAHSQGAVIVFAALMQIAGENEEQEPFELPPEDAREYDRADATEPEQAQQIQPITKYRELDRLVKEAAKDKEVDKSQVDSIVLETDKPLEAVGLVTFGNPITQLYGPFFPTHFGTYGRLAQLRRKLFRFHPPLDGNAWRSFYRPTDYIGKSVFVLPGGVLEAQDGPWTDMRLPEADRAMLPIEAHSNYPTEDELIEWYKKVVDQMTNLP